MNLVVCLIAGNWFTYTFGEGSNGMASNVMLTNGGQIDKLAAKRRQNQWEISSDDSTVVVDAATDEHPAAAATTEPSALRLDALGTRSLFGLETPNRSIAMGQPLHSYIAELLENGRNRRPTSTNRCDQEQVY